MLNDNFLWVEKYRPKTVATTILPTELKSTFQEFVNQNNVPNLILSGSAGIGKTTVAKAMLEEIGCDYIVINGSDEGRSIDVLRVEIKNFASSVSFSGGRKYVIIDEADYLNANSVQPALRNFMEEYSSNCGFILTCNFLNKIIAPLHSRCSVIEFKLPKNEKQEIGAQIFTRCKEILDAENIDYDKKVVAKVVMKFFPDNRRVLNELQRYSATGKIDAGILTNFEDVTIESLITSLKNKEFSNVRKWVSENVEGDCSHLMRKIYDTMNDHIAPSSIPQVVVTLADYQYKSAFVADQEINLMAMLTEFMVDCEFK
jgi:DNA polymerase III delta prime subunit